MTKARIYVTITLISQANASKIRSAVSVRKGGRFVMMLDRGWCDNP